MNSLDVPNDLSSLRSPIHSKKNFRKITENFRQLCLTGIFRKKTDARTLSPYFKQIRTPFFNGQFPLRNGHPYIRQWRTPFSYGQFLLNDGDLYIKELRTLFVCLRTIYVKKCLVLTCFVNTVNKLRRITDFLFLLFFCKKYINNSVLKYTNYNF